MTKSDFIDTYLSTVLDKISKEKKQVILLGDFNINLLSPETDLDSSNFIDTISSFSLKPTINCPTRITDTTETLIDNIIVSETSKFVSGNLTVGISDHLPQFTILDVMKSEPETRTFYRDWKSLDETQFKKDFNDIDWEQTLQFQLSDPDHSLNRFIDVINSLVDTHIPLKVLTKTQKNNKPWITKGIRKSISNRDKLLKSSHRAKTVQEKSKFFKQYKKVRNKIVEIIRLSKENYFKNYFSKNVKSPKNIWKGIGDLIQRKGKSQKDISLKINNNNVTDTNTIAHEFNSFFTNIASKVRSSISRCNKTYNSFLPARIRNSIFFTPIEDHEIVKLIQGIDCNKAVGPSSIPNKILSILPKEIAKILASIFNLSLTTGKFLTLLKTAKVIPVYKNKGDDQITSNYRPIALLSNIDNIFEKLVHKRLVSFFDREKVLYDQQFGFRNKHSTLHNLIVLSEEIRKNIDKGNFSCSIFFDLAKAFDVIDHEILLTKLNHYGIRGIANDWIRSYLIDRKQFVHYKCQQSSLQHIKYGVPQGSVLGPVSYTHLTLPTIYSV